MNRQKTLLQQMIVVASFAGLVACDGSNAYRKVEPVRVVDLEGVYRERVSASTPQDEFESYDYAEYAIVNGVVTYRRLDADSLEPKETPVGVFKENAKDKSSFDFTPATGLTQLANSQTDVKPFQQFVDGAERVRVLKHNGEIHLTRIQGNQRSSQTWVYVGSIGDKTFQKASRKAGDLLQARASFLGRWKDKTLVLFEQVHEVHVAGTKYIHPYPAFDKDGKALILPVEGADNVDPTVKKVLNFVKLKWTSLNQVVINDSIPGESKLRIRRGRGEKEAARVDLEITAKGDANVFAPASLHGVASDDGEGLQFVAAGIDKGNFDKWTDRYQPEGVTSMKPIPGTTELDPPAVVQPVVPGNGRRQSPMPHTPPPNGKFPRQPGRP